MSRAVTSCAAGRLGRAFFDRPPDGVAHDLVGAAIVLGEGSSELRALIVETEAYGGSDDSASHAFRGSTNRCEVMFGPPGVLYVYRIYGLHWCLNVVTEGSGTASAVLLRAAELCARPDGDLRPTPKSVHLAGPGNLTRGLGVTGADNGSDCCDDSVSRVAFYENATVDLGSVARSARIGISRGRERLSRYFLDGHPAVTSAPGVSRRGAR